MDGRCWEFSFADKLAFGRALADDTFDAGFRVLGMLSETEIGDCKTEVSDYKLNSGV
jgi:hypothetical protein